MLIDVGQPFHIEGSFHQWRRHAPGDARLLLAVRRADLLDGDDGELRARLYGGNEPLRAALAGDVAAAARALLEQPAGGAPRHAGAVARRP